MSDQPENLIPELLRPMRAISDTRHEELTRHMAATNRRLTSIERTLAGQRADPTTDAANSIARLAELEDRLDALAARLPT